MCGTDLIGGGQTWAACLRQMYATLIVITMATLTSLKHVFPLQLQSTQPMMFNWSMATSCKMKGHQGQLNGNPTSQAKKPSLENSVPQNMTEHMNYLVTK